MSTAITIRSSIADDINAAHAAADQALRGAVKACIRAGDLLIEAKRLHGKHGQWSKWLADNITFSDRLARAYMQLARLPESKRQRVADLPLREALSAIRGREQRVADAEERMAEPPPGPACFVHTSPDGTVTVVPAPGLRVAPEHRPLLPPEPPRPKPPPPTPAELADDMILQLAGLVDQYGANCSVKVTDDDLRAAFQQRFGAAERAEIEEIEEGHRDAFLLRADQAIDLAKNAATLIEKFDATKEHANAAQRAANAWGNVAFSLKSKIPEARPS